jgi:crossover junction endodeoxyribonuclease RusA
MTRRPKGQNEPPVAPLFDVCIHGQPVSAQTKRRSVLEAWKSRVRRESVAAWPPGLLPIEGRVRLRVTHYYETPAGDMDNIRKAIQDVLQGIAYLNDRQVSDGTDRRFNINGPFVARWWSPRLGLAFSDGRPFIHIEVWAYPDQEVIL